MLRRMTAPGKRRCLLAPASALAGVAWLAGLAAHQSALAQSSGPKAATASATAIVRGVDCAGSRVTMDHGPIPALGMPALSINFEVADPKLLERVRPGDAVNFRITRSGLGWIVTGLERN